ncbi:hypothetical protein SH601_08270 [Gracilibacillus sp. S3-1-1]|uniref:Uncharacterized protein n=1 Tax=Gracilibacillus pellucidus TaxID=3095368 RepID=A0ACC6M576_9BACI|nr:hypothetical protein [Gracilibacillus sp. S3-1-1]MDX8045982.1 hypothetical protein [Gracilibacillus sp. S3-1-1]
MKVIIRAFSLGLLTASVIIGATYYLDKPEQETPTTSPSIDESIQTLQDNGYFVYDNDLEVKVDELEQEIESLQEVEDNREVTDENAAHEEVTIAIEEGMTMPDITDFLVDHQLISDTEQFVTYLESNDLTRYIQIGEFTLNSSMTIEEIASAITRQQTEE